MKLMLPIFSLFLSTVSYAGPDYDEMIKGLPKEVVSIIDRRIGCNYWPGEMPNNPNEPEVRESGRPQMIEKNLKKLKCSHLEKDETAIQKKYKNKKNVIEALKQASTMNPTD